jgi:hypothetical protein
MTENIQYTGRLAPIKLWFSQITEKNMLKGTCIVTLTGILAAVIAYSNAIRIEVPIAGAGGIIKNISAATALILTLLGWILSSIIYHAGASILGGKGSLNRMFALSSYASIPLLLQEILRFIYYVVMGQVPLASSTINILTLIVDHLTFFNIASLVLTTVAVMLHYGISGRKAAFVSLLPILISITFTLLLRLYFVGSTATSGSQVGGLFSGLRPAG